MTNRTNQQTANARAQFAALQTKYASKLPAKIGDIQRLFHLVSEQNDTINQSTMGALAAKLHNLIGSSAIYGYPELSKTARNVYNLLHKKSSNNRIPSLKDLALMETLIKQLEKHLP